MPQIVAAKHPVLHNIIIFIAVMIVKILSQSIMIVMEILKIMIMKILTVMIVMEIPKIEIMKILSQS